MDDHIRKQEEDVHQAEPNLSFVAQNETVSTTTNMSPPPNRTVPSSSRPRTLQLSGSRMGSSILLTPGDYNKLVLNTPELDERLRNYAIVSSGTPTIQLQTPDLINVIAAQPASNITFATDGQPSPGAKVIQELLSAQQQPLTDNTGRQYIVIPPEAQQLFQHLSMDGEQQFTEVLQKVMTANTSASTTDGHNPTYLSNYLTPTSQQQQQQRQDIATRDRSISSSMDTSMNGNESSNSAISSTTSSPMTTHIHQNTIMLNKIKDEPQHVPSSRANHANSSIEHISLEQNEVLKKEKKRERNRQAAQKCRTRKLTRIAELQQRVNELQEKNKHLSNTTDRLKTDIERLERQLQEHQSQGCSLITA